MKPFGNISLRIGRIASLAVPFAVLTLILSSPATSVAQSSALPCSWPTEITGTGLRNVFNPDTNATYWVMTIDTTQWKAMIVTGQYPLSRFFSFTSYSGALGKGDVTGSIIDANIAPDPGSNNPFQPGASEEPHNYTLTIDGNQTTSGNHVNWGSSQSVYIIYRIYVADKGLSRMAGVPLPSVTLVDAEGNTHQTQACPSTTPGNELKPLIALLKDSPAVSTGLSSCLSNQQPQQDVVTFTTNATGGGIFPNPANTYVSARNLCFEPDRIVVIRGKGAVFPDTFDDGSIFQPSNIQMRYWSMCNDDEVIPFPAVACQADHETNLDDEGFFTYVVSPSEIGSPDSPPSWVPPDATWLRWGDPTIAKALIFREMLPMPGFTLVGDYFPKGVYCNKQLFIAQGWQGCFAAAGVEGP